jgi:hypothetical protein
MTRRLTTTVALVLGLSLSGALAGCTSARDTLGTSVSPCFKALAVASEAVHDRGTFEGVRLVSITSLGHTARLRLSARAGPSVHSVCVVSYKGTFRLDQVEKPVGRVPAGGVGRYAIVVVSKPQDKLIGTLVRLTQPLRFSHPV